MHKSQKQETGAGKIFLVGAGPGDPGLLTLKGAACLEAAEVVVYDYLADRKLLEMAPPAAEVIYVGKKGGNHTMGQEDINRLLVAKGSEGKTVVRLKGGDPFIFGRGGEEALALKEAGVPFEIVPGVSSAYAAPAFAGIPVTHRGLTTDVAFVTGHEDPDKPESMIRWDRLATGVGTLVFLMGMKNLPHITAKLIEGGRPPETPAALIRWGGTPRQETLTGTVGDIAERAAAEGFKAPAITVVGDVVGLRDRLRWFEDRPLFGKRVVVTRSRAQASELVEALAARGAAPLEFPTIRVIPPADGYAALDAAIARLKEEPAPYDWVVFTSANGVEHFFSRLNEAGDVRDLKGVKLGAIGPATAAALSGRGLRADFVPGEYRAEAVVEGLLRRGAGESRVLIPRAREAREVLPDRLAEAGAVVEVVPAYETVADDAGAGELKQMLKDGEIDIITFTSSSTVRNFAALLDGPGPDRLPENVTVACIGPVTAATAKELGIRVDVVAAEYTIPGLVEALVASQ